MFCRQLINEEVAMGGGKSLFTHWVGTFGTDVALVVGLAIGQWDGVHHSVMTLDEAFCAPSQHTSSRLRIECSLEACFFGLSENCDVADACASGSDSSKARQALRRITNRLMAKCSASD